MLEVFFILSIAEADILHEVKKDDIFQSYQSITGFGTGRQKKKFNQKLVQ
jgi:hypothetical protein